MLHCRCFLTERKCHVAVEFPDNNNKKIKREAKKKDINKSVQFPHNNNKQTKKLKETIQKR